MAQQESTSKQAGRRSRDPYKDHWTEILADQLALFGVQLFASGGSGAIAKTAVAPFERVKILLQVQRMSDVPSSIKYTSAMDALKRIPKLEGGVMALWRGNGANIMRFVPEVGVKFALHDQFKVMFTPADGKLGPLEKLGAGAATGVLQTLVTYPLDICRTRITADTRPADQRLQPGVVSCLLRTAQQEGMFGLYRGVTVSMATVVPYLSLSFAMYDELKGRLPDDPQSREQLWFPLLKMSCGSVAAVSAQTLLYPVDTVRRCVQMSGSPGQTAKYRGAIDAFRQIVRQEGFMSLYRGCLVSCLKTSIGAPIGFMAYDWVKSIMKKVDPRTGMTSPL